MYIVFEGIDGCGKDTQADMLTRSFQARGIQTLRLNEPDQDNLIGQLLRHCLQRGLYVQSHAALFLADRMALLPEKVIPALEAGKTVVSSRSFLSTLVYQPENWPLDWLICIHQQLQAKPDVVFILDLDPKIALKRLVDRSGKPEYYEREDTLERVRERYLRRAEDPAVHNLLAPGGRFEVVDANGAPAEVHAEILRRLGA